MNSALIILGSNKGERLQNLEDAIRLIALETGVIAKKSGIYVTAPWGNPNQPDFFNIVIQLETELSAGNLLTIILKFEEKLGRVRTAEKWMERTIDIDILFYNKEIINQIDLRIPHPYIQDRKFVLVPLAEIMPNFIHPIFNKSIEQLLLECTDKLEVTKNQKPIA